MYGSAGTGKTLILCEALKIKLSQLQSQGRRVRILVTTYNDKRSTNLLNNLKTKYLAMEPKSMMIVSIFHTGGRTEGDARPFAFFKALFLSL